MRARRRPSRRQFLLGAASASATALGCFPDVGGTWPQLTEACLQSSPVQANERSPVIEVLRADSVLVDPSTQRASVQEGPVREMVDEALTALGGAAPWRTLLPDFVPGMRVGIKVNVLNELCPTSVPLVKALVGSLSAGLELDPRDIIVWDRRLDELERAGFTSESVGATVMGTVNSMGDSRGPGYGEPICGMVAGKAPRLSRILTELTDLTLNCPVLKTHAICGVTAALKNVYGVIDIPGEYHRNLSSALPALYQLPPVRSRFRLALVDALVAVTTGGTSSPPDTVPRRILLSADPVATDAYALALVEKLRAEKEIGLPPVDRSVMGWLEKAAAEGLGTLEYELRER